jgi:pyrroline-5-carboxylate reductase
MEARQLSELKIAFIGAGNMAEALINGLAQSGIISAERIHISDVNSGRMAELAQRYGVIAHDENSAAARESQVCILAVKPQVLPEVLADTLPGISPETLIISIAAGIRTQRIESILPAGQRVVRVMPNTPALVGMGISAICGGSKAGDTDLELCELLVGTVGQTLRIDEEQMDALTALSGSGPAYQFYLLENMIKAGVAMGFDEATAGKLACATAEGATRLMIESGLTAAELRARVTSKGGTTAAAISVLDENKVDEAIRSALLAARARSRELSQE